MSTKTTKAMQNKLNMFSLEDIFNPMYANYIEGLYWCNSMYYHGKCYDYNYIYNTKSKPHIYGIMMCITLNNTYNIITNPPIPLKLYGILLMPYKAKLFLSEKQQIIANRILEKKSNLYENINTDIINDIIHEYNNIIKTIPDDIIIINTKPYIPYGQFNIRIV